MSGGSQRARDSRGTGWSAGLVDGSEPVDSFLKDFGQLVDELLELASPALAEHGELDAEGLAAVGLADDTLDAHWELTDAEGHLHSFIFAKRVRDHDINEAAAEAEVGDFAPSSSAGGKAADFCFAATMKAGMPPPIALLFGHTDPFNSH